MAKNKEMTEEERVALARKDHDEFNIWKGKADSLYIVAYAAPLLKLGFSTEQIMNMYINDKTIELASENKDADIQIARINAKISDEPCQCEDCREARGETGL